MSNERIEYLYDKPYKYVSEKAKSVGREIEKKLVGMSIKEAVDLLECVRRAILENNVVFNERD